MTAIFISPAEPARVRSQLSRNLGTQHTQHISSSTESKGVDFMWRAREQWFGVQRKELNDLLASMSDGRLSKEVGQMREHLSHPMLIIERQPKWTADGIMMDDTWGQRFTWSGWVGIHASLGHAGVTVLHSDSIAQTVDSIVALVNWSAKPNHLSLLQRPGPAGNGWGKASSRDWGVHFIQGIPGIGPGVAGAVFDHFGRVPLRWDCEPSELGKVPGVGKKRVEQLIGALS